MNNIFKKIIQFALKWFAKIYLWRIKPRVIVIAGTTGRHWIKEAIAETLKEKKFSVRTNVKNFNAEIGLPLSILGLPSGEGNFWGWFAILFQSLKKVFDRRLERKPFGEFLVLEMAIDRPDNMNYLLSIVKPEIAIFTTITMIYQENFENLDKIALEYRKLIKSLPWNGLAILNFDDERVRNLAETSHGRVITYGFNEGADFRAKDIKKILKGQQFKLGISRHFRQNQLIIPLIRINRFGSHHVYAALVKEIIKENCKISAVDFFSQISIKTGKPF
jgi:UDP-N-acetylmuramoyl-tripeptide--D-alanyl-D-alanine ligase